MYNIYKADSTQVLLPKDSGQENGEIEKNGNTNFYKPKKDKSNKNKKKNVFNSGV